MGASRVSVSVGYGIRTIARIVTVLVLVAAVVGTTATASATGTTEPAPPRRIEFAPGTQYGSVAGTVGAGATVRYVLAADEGQTMIVVAASVEQNAQFTVFDPDGAAMEPMAVPVFVGELPTTGDYVIEVSAAPGSASTYGLGVYIPGQVPLRIKFAPGTNTASVHGAVVRGTANQYLLRAAAGQTMIVEIDSVEDNAVLDIYAPDGTGLATAQQRATVQLPADGNYRVVVGTTRGNVTYDITVSID